MKAKKIVIVEDESLIALDISRTLKKEGYTVCAVVDNGKEAIDAVCKYQPDLILMDIYIEGPIDGITTAKRIKETNANVPIVFLTAYADRATVSEAIKTSPESYLVKPFKRPELLATIELALFKAQESPEPINSIVELCTDYTYDKIKRQAMYHGSQIPLTKKEMQLLEILLQNTGSVVPFDLIELELWPEKAVSETTRRTLVHRLRNKLGGSCIETVQGVGLTIQIE